MKKISTLVVGLSLLASSALYAADHKMMDHGNMNMDNGSMKMDHGNMNMSKGNMGAYHNEMMTNGYKVSLSSEKPLVSGNNKMSVMLMKDGKAVTDAQVKIKFFMPEMPGMPYMEYKTSGKKVGNKFDCDVNFGMNGTWQYQLRFKTSDGEVHKTRGSVNF